MSPCQRSGVSKFGVSGISIRGSLSVRRFAKLGVGFSLVLKRHVLFFFSLQFEPKRPSPSGLNYRLLNCNFFLLPVAKKNNRPVSFDEDKKSSTMASSTEDYGSELQELQWGGGTSNSHFLRNSGSHYLRTGSGSGYYEAEDLEPGGRHQASHHRGYYSPPGTNYTIVERPPSAPHHHSSHTTPYRHSRVHTTTTNPVAVSASGAISPEQVIRWVVSYFSILFPSSIISTQFFWGLIKIANSSNIKVEDRSIFSLFLHYQVIKSVVSKIFHFITLFNHFLQLFWRLMKIPIFSNFKVEHRSIFTISVLRRWAIATDAGIFFSFRLENGFWWEKKISVLPVATGYNPLYFLKASMATMWFK